jgi:hypothetical protein
MGIGYVQDGTGPVGEYPGPRETGRLDSGLLQVWGRLRPERPGKAAREREQKGGCRETGQSHDQAICLEGASQPQALSSQRQLNLLRLDLGGQFELRLVDESGELFGDPGAEALFDVDQLPRVPERRPVLATCRLPAWSSRVGHR